MKFSLEFGQIVALTTPRAQANASKEDIAGKGLFVPDCEFYTDIVYISRIQATESESVIPVGVHTLFYYRGFVFGCFIVVWK